MKTTALIVLALFYTSLALAQTTPFISVWKTDNPGATTSGNNKVQIPLLGGTGDYNIYWEEVSNPSNNATLVEPAQNITIVFPAPGIFRISIKPVNMSAIGVGFAGGNMDHRKLLSIEQWGNSDWDLLKFDGCSNLTISATDIPKITTNSFSFTGCSSISSVPNMNSWNVSNITSMGNMFSGATNFNEPIGNWNVSNVTGMNSMFSGAANFNQPLGNWNVSKVTSMGYMFYEASSFNQPIGNWNVGNAFVFQDMFRWATAFNQDLGNWNMKNVSDMASPLYYMLASSGMDCNNYSKTLIGWGNNSQITNKTVTFAPSGKEYGPHAETARNILISKGWNIIGDELNPSCQSGPTTAPGSESYGNIFNSLSVYPNPAGDYVEIKNIPQASTLKIINMAGKVVYENFIEGNNEIVNVSGFRNGIYFVQIESNGRVASKKLVIH
jgi:surface protein